MQQPHKNALVRNYYIRIPRLLQSIRAKSLPAAVTGRRQTTYSVNYSWLPMGIPWLSSRCLILVIGSMMLETLISWLMAAMK